MHFFFKKQIFSQEKVVQTEIASHAARKSARYKVAPKNLYVLDAHGGNRKTLRSTRDPFTTPCTGVHEISKEWSCYFPENCLVSTQWFCTY